MSRPIDLDFNEDDFEFDEQSKMDDLARELGIDISSDNEDEDEKYRQKSMNLIPPTRTQEVTTITSSSDEEDEVVEEVTIVEETRPRPVPLPLLVLESPIDPTSLSATVTTSDDPSELLKSISDKLVKTHAQKLNFDFKEDGFCIIDTRLLEDMNDSTTLSALSTKIIDNQSYSLQKLEELFVENNSTMPYLNGSPLDNFFGYYPYHGRSYAQDAINHFVATRIVDPFIRKILKEYDSNILAMSLEGSYNNRQNPKGLVQFDFNQPFIFNTYGQDTHPKIIVYCELVKIEQEHDQSPCFSAFIGSHKMTKGSDIYNILKPKSEDSKSKQELYGESTIAITSIDKMDALKQAYGEPARIVSKDFFRVILVDPRLVHKYGYDHTSSYFTSKFTVHKRSQVPPNTYNNLSLNHTTCYPTQASLNLMTSMPYMFQIRTLADQAGRQQTALQKKNKVSSEGQIEFRKYGRILKPHSLPEDMIYMYGYKRSNDIETNLKILNDYLNDPQATTTRDKYDITTKMSMEEKISVKMDKWMVPIFDIKTSGRDKNDIFYTDPVIDSNGLQLITDCQTSSVKFNLEMIGDIEMTYASHEVPITPKQQSIKRKKGSPTGISPPDKKTNETEEDISIQKYSILVNRYIRQLPESRRLEILSYMKTWNKKYVQNALTDEDNEPFGEIIKFKGYNIYMTDVITYILTREKKALLQKEKELNKNIVPTTKKTEEPIGISDIPQSKKSNVSVIDQLRSEIRKNKQDLGYTTSRRLSKFKQERMKLDRILKNMGEMLSELSEQQSIDPIKVLDGYIDAYTSASMILYNLDVFSRKTPIVLMNVYVNEIFYMIYDHIDKDVMAYYDYEGSSDMEQLYDKIKTLDILKMYGDDPEVRELKLSTNDKIRIVAFIVDESKTLQKFYLKKKQDINDNIAAKLTEEDKNGISVVDPIEYLLHCLQLCSARMLAYDPFSTYITRRTVLNKSVDTQTFNKNQMEKRELVKELKTLLPQEIIAKEALKHKIVELDEQKPRELIQFIIDREIYRNIITFKQFIDVMINNVIDNIEYDLRGELITFSSKEITEITVYVDESVVTRYKNIIFSNRIDEDVQDSTDPDMYIRKQYVLKKYEYLAERSSELLQVLTKVIKLIKPEYTSDDTTGGTLDNDTINDLLGPSGVQLRTLDDFSQLQYTPSAKVQEEIDRVLKVKAEYLAKEIEEDVEGGEIVEEEESEEEEEENEEEVVIEEEDE
jgi:hypothetical protein